MLRRSNSRQTRLPEGQASCPNPWRIPALRPCSTNIADGESLDEAAKRRPTSPHRSAHPGRPRIAIPR
jgi:hypothetical protein